MANPHTKAEIERLRAQSYDLHLRELSVREIATALKIDKGTVARYVREAVAENLASVNAMTMERAKAEGIARKKTLLKASWVSYSNAGENRSAYLGHIRGAQNDLDKLQGVSINHLDVTTDRESLNMWESLARVLDDCSGGDTAAGGDAAGTGTVTD